MERNSYGLRNGSIYRKMSSTKYTYVFCASVEDFLLTALREPEVRESLIQHIGLLTNLLSKAACQLIRQLKIDFNFIECQPLGCCFDIQEKKFVMDPPSLVGSPRTYIKYVYHEKLVPYPIPFVEGKFVYGHYCCYCFSCHVANII